MKKFSLILPLSALVLIALFPSCKFGCIKGSGHNTIETRKLGSFSKLDIEGGFKVVLKQDSSETITITTDDNLMKYIHTNLSGDRLKISSRKNLCSSGLVVIEVGVRKLEMIKGSGAINLSNEGKLNLQDLKMDFSGASNVTLNMSAANVNTEGSGATELHLSGQASSHKISLTGSGKLYAFDFVVGSYRIETTGATNCEINVLKELNVNTTGASEIKYKGNPSSIQNDKSGSSKLTKVE